MSISIRGAIKKMKRIHPSYLQTFKETLAFAAEIKTDYPAKTTGQILLILGAVATRKKLFEQAQDIWLKSQDAAHPRKIDELSRLIELSRRELETLGELSLAFLTRDKHRGKQKDNIDAKQR